MWSKLDSVNTFFVVSGMLRFNSNIIGLSGLQ